MKARFFVIAVTTTLAGCFAESGPPDPQLDTAESAEGMFARDSYDASSSRMVPPFTAAAIEQHTLYGRAVGASDAFASCVANSMAESYMNIADPNPGLSRAAQIAAAFESFRHSYVSLEHGLRPSSDAPNAAASAHIGSPTDHGTKDITYYDGYRADNKEWTNGLYDQAVYRPWHWRAGTIIHEFMHTQGYTHADSTCSDTEANGVSSCAVKPECAWTSYCGGSGTPPAGMTYGTSGDSSREFVAVKNGRADTEYYLHGEPSAPYIYGSCASRVVERSGEVCGLATDGCVAGKLRLISAWTGTKDDPQSSTTCTCVQDPRHIISLRSLGGWNWTATSGGSVHTNLARGWGAAQTFYAMEYGGPSGWIPGEAMAVKTWDGKFVTNTFTTTLTSPNHIKFVNASGSAAAIGNGSVVNISDTTSSGGMWWAYDNGAVVTKTDSLGASTNHDFVITEPRYHLVYLKSPHGKFVNVDAAGLFFNKRSQAILEYGTAANPVDDASGKLVALDPAIVSMQNDAAFWLVDYDGGEVDDGDVVSIQIFKGEAWSFLSTWGTDGHAKKKNIAGDDERFIINKQAAGALVGHGDSITLKNVGTGLYMVAMPADYFDGQIRGYGEFEGSWTKFDLMFVHSFDLDRQAKW